MTVPIPLLEQNIGQAIRVDESRSGAAHCFLGRSRSRQGVEVCHVRYTEWARRDGREAEGGGLLEHFHHNCTQLRVSLNQACALSADIS